MLEEINDDDIDNMDFDPADFDPQNVIGSSAHDSATGPARLVPTGQKQQRPATSSSSSAQPSPAEIMERLSAGMADPARQASGSGSSGLTADNNHVIRDEADMEQFKEWSVLYPCYFDAARTHKEGRRVSQDLAVHNPQAYTIMVALRSLGVPCILEANKTHPRDWANTGRVRFLLRDDEVLEIRAAEGRAPVKNKRHLYHHVGKYLREHPATKDTPFEGGVFEQMKNMPGFTGERPTCEPLAKPRGWKINDILPVLSPAMTGGEAASNMMEQMSKSMFGGMMDAPPQIPAVPKKPKRINIRR